jgi:hypothetical protein
MKKTSKINPNNFFTIACKWVKGGLLNHISVEITRAYGHIHSMEKIESDDGKTYYNLFVWDNKGGTRIRYLLTEKTFLELRSQLEQVDFNVPIIETQEQIKDVIKDVVKEEMNKSKTSNPIFSLEV